MLDVLMGKPVKYKEVWLSDMNYKLNDGFFGVWIIWSNSKKNTIQ